jgi:L-serine/L-threonine ammonia-lyase
MRASGAARLAICTIHKEENMAIHLQTPLFQSQPMSKLTGKAVWMKLEAVQPPGSFKIRGIGAVCERYVAQGKKRFVSSSGGNAGIAASYAGRILSVPVLVVVPESTSDSAKTLIRDQGAEVLTHGCSWMEANAFAQSLLQKSDGFVHPFDDPVLWHGHATMIDEVARANLQPDAVILSVGGGGLLAGVAEGLKRNGMEHVPIVAAETEGAASFAESVTANRRVTLRSIETVATSLGAKQVCERAFELAHVHDIRCAVVNDQTAVAATRRFLDDHRLLVEPACGASLSVVYDQLGVIENFQNILIIVCGGAAVTVRGIEDWTEKLRLRS